MIYHSLHISEHEILYIIIAIYTEADSALIFRRYIKILELLIVVNIVSEWELF